MRETEMRRPKGEQWRLFFLVLLIGVFFRVDLHAFTLNVVGCDESNTCNLPVSGFRWLVEEDTTHPVTPGAIVTNSLGVSIHQSYAPVVAKGTETTDTAVIDVPSTKRYVVSVLSLTGEYTVGGALVQEGQDAVTVTVHRLPIPTAQISVYVFHDTLPINNEPDIPFEEGLAGFSVLLFDQLGQMSQDVFGNPLGTTYNADGSIAVMGNGVITTDSKGEALIKYIAPGKYGVRIVPPPGQQWYQTTTIEGTPGIDAWVKANEPKKLIEFGPGLYHVFFGFVEQMDQLGTLPNPGGAAGTVTGQVVDVHTSRPPSIQLFSGNPVPECFVGLNILSAGAQRGVYVRQCNTDSTFTIENVPPGTYQLVIWDKPLDSIIAFRTVIVPDTGGTINLDKIPINRWFGTLEGSVFYDTNQNGFRDADERGIMEQNINIRFRDGSLYQAQPTDLNGEYSFSEVFPFFRYLIVEVDFARFKATGMTTVVDNGGELAPGESSTPQIQPDTGLPYRTELGPVLLQAMTLYADQTNKIDWGKAAYSQGENGGISGIVYYATTRAENDPRYAAADPWEPGIPRVQVNLYQDADRDGIIDDRNGDGAVTLADVDNHPFGWADGTAPKGDEDEVRCGNGTAFCSGDALDIVTTDGWDDAMPAGCVGPQELVYGQPVQECAETLKTWNQVRPGVFDGGYAFSTNLPAGTYIVEAVPPKGYELVREEDKNVDFGDEYTPSPLLTPPVCVGDSHLVPAELSLFPGVAGFYAGQTRPLCDRKQVTVSAGKNTAADFFFFTEVPKAARGVGLINNDLAIEGDTSSPVYTEKSPASWIPVSLQDFAGNEFSRIYSDQWGSYNFLVPSTYSVNIPSPTGVSPNMVRICLNHPGPITDPATGQLVPDPHFDPRYSLTCYTFDFWPGKTTYLDTPVIPVAAFSGITSVHLDCELPDGTPVISDVTGPGAVGPYASVANGSVTVTITSPGTMSVPNPDCGFFDTTCPQRISRDYGFGATQGTVTVGGVSLSNVVWSNTVITGTVPAGMTTGQLVVTRGDNGKSTVEGITLTVGGPDPVIVQPGQSIQTAIDAADPGSFIIVRPGVYNENVVMWKKVRLQGSSAFSTVINAAPQSPEKLQLWRDKINGLVSGGYVSLVPGEDPDIQLEEAGVTVFGKDDGSFGAPGEKARIDGFTITSSTGGGGITVNGYASYLTISNNRIINNAGTHGGGIRIGTPSLTDPSCSGYCGSANDHISIHHNHIAQNGALAATTGGGGIGIHNGSDFYQVTDNYICGNFTTQKGGGIAHFGLSDQGLIANNKILFNESSFGTLTGGEGGGILVKGEPALAGAPGSLTPGTGSVTIQSNLIQGNLAGSGNGGGILASFVNGQDVYSSPGDSGSWYALAIFNNIIINNAAGFAGGGIFLEDIAKGRIINTTIADNDSTATGANAFIGGGITQTSPQGAGIVSRVHSAELAAVIGSGTGAEFSGFSNPVLENTIVWHNRSFYWDTTANGGLGGLVSNTAMPFFDLQVSGSSSLSLAPRYCILTDAAGYDVSNFSTDPAFVAEYANVLQTAIAPQEGGNFINVTFTPLKPSGDYHIRGASPAINAGTNAHLGLVGTDYDGMTRPQGSTVDIGADEYTGGGSTVLALVSPNGGEVLPSGSAFMIRWNAPASASTFRLHYSLNNGTSWTLIANNVTGTSYTWTVPRPTGNVATALVRVIGYNASGTAVGVDVSNAPFTIEVVKVTAPNGGESLSSGSTFTISWTSNATVRPIASVQLQYSVNGGNTYRNITTLSGNPGSYIWSVPAVGFVRNRSTVRVTLRDSNGANIGRDESDAFLTLRP